MYVLFWNCTWLRRSPGTDCSFIWNIFVWEVECLNGMVATRCSSSAKIGRRSVALLTAVLRKVQLGWNIYIIWGGIMYVIYISCDCDNCLPKVYLVVFDTFDWSESLEPWSECSPGKKAKNRNSSDDVPLYYTLTVLVGMRTWQSGSWVRNVNHADIFWKSKLVSYLGGGGTQ